MRFQLQRTPALAPLLSAFGGTRRQSFVELSADGLKCRFGFLFNDRFRYGDIRGVERDRWPWYGGLGWRTDFRGRVAIVGTLKNVVRISIDGDHRSRVLFSVPCRELYVSLEDPDGFVRALSEKLAGVTEPVN